MEKSTTKQKKAVTKKIQWPKYFNVVINLDVENKPK